MTDEEISALSDEELDNLDLELAVPDDPDLQASAPDAPGGDPVSFPMLDVPETETVQQFPAPDVRVGYPEGFIPMDNDYLRSTIPEGEEGIEHFTGKDFISMVMNMPGSISENLVGLLQAVASPAETVDALGDISVGATSLLAKKILGKSLPSGLLGEMGDELGLGELVDDLGLRRSETVPQPPAPDVGVGSPEGFIPMDQDYLQPTSGSGRKDLFGNDMRTVAESEAMAKQLGTFLWNRYGPHLRKTLVEDPFGVILDIVGGATALKKIVGSQKFTQLKTTLKKLPKKSYRTVTEGVSRRIPQPMKEQLAKYGNRIPFDAIQNLAKDISTPGSILTEFRPIEKTLRASRRVLGFGQEKVATGIGGLATGESPIPFDEFVLALNQGGERAELAIKAMRGNLPIQEYVNSLYRTKRVGLRKLYGDMNKEYTSLLKALEPKEAINVGRAKERFLEYLKNDWGIEPKMKPGLSDPVDPIDRLIRGIYLGDKWPKDPYLRSGPLLDPLKPPAQGSRVERFPKGLIEFRGLGRGTKVESPRDIRVIQETATRFLDQIEKMDDIGFVDQLKITLGRIANQSKVADQGAAASNRAVDFLSEEIRRVAPKWDDMKAQWEMDKRIVKEMDNLIAEKTDTALSKVMGTMKEKMTKERSRIVLRKLEIAGQEAILAPMSGYLLSEIWPVGLHGKSLIFGAAAGVTLNLVDSALLMGLGVTSPRLVGEFLKLAQVPKIKVEKMADWVKEVNDMIPKKMATEGLNYAAILAKMIDAGLEPPPLPLLYRPENGVRDRAMGLTSP